MAIATTYGYSKFLIKIGDGGAPEVFTDPCGLTSKGFTRTANLNDTNMPDCDDPDAPSWLGREVVSYQASIAGAGIVAEECNRRLGSMVDGRRNPQCQDRARAQPAHIAWTMPAKLQEFAITAERGGKVEMAVTLVSDGEVPAAVVTP